MQLENVLNIISDKLEGRLISQDENDLLVKALDKNILPQWYLNLLMKFRLVGTEFSLSEEKDISEMGVELKWLTPEQTINEAKETYPGILACKNGYLPVGMCLEGSGDPYFLEIVGNNNPKLVRIIHDSCTDDDFTSCEVEIVSNCLSDFFQFSKIV